MIQRRERLGILKYTIRYIILYMKLSSKVTHDKWVMLLWKEEGVENLQQRVC